MDDSSIFHIAQMKRFFVLEANCGGKIVCLIVPDMQNKIENMLQQIVVNFLYAFL